MELLSAACTYAAARLLRVPLSLPECAAAAQAPPLQIGTVCLRLIRHLQLSLPPTNIPEFLKRAVAAWPGAEGGGEGGAPPLPGAPGGGRALDGPGAAEDERRRVLGDAVVLWEFGQIRGLDLGRNPLSLGAAGLYLAASVAFRGPFRGGLTLEDVSELMHTIPNTVRERRSELVKELAEVAAGFPLGRDVTIRSVTSPKVLPLVLTLLRGLLPPTAPPALEPRPPGEPERPQGEARGAEGGSEGAGSGELVGVPVGLPPSFKKKVAEVERVAAAAQRVKRRLALWGLEPEKLSGADLIWDPAQPGLQAPPPAGRPPPPAGENDLYLERLLLAGCSESDLLAGGDLSAFLAAGRGGGGGGERRTLTRTTWEHTSALTSRRRCTTSSWRGSGHPLRGARLAVVVGAPLSYPNLHIVAIPFLSIMSRHVLVQSFSASIHGAGAPHREGEYTARGTGWPFASDGPEASGEEPSGPGITSLGELPISGEVE